MNRFRNMGWIILGSIMLLLAGCGGAPAAAPTPTPQVQESPQPTEVPTASPTASPTVEPTVEPTEEPTKEPTEPVEGQPPTALEAARTVMRALEKGDMSVLAAWVHPEKGLRFSPYAYVDTKADLVFTRDQVEKLMKDPKVRVWRYFAGSGDEIKMTYAEYHKRFVYDADFIKEAEIVENKTLGQGTTINNLFEVYPEASHSFVEYYIDGIDPKYEGMDWRSLRLVFEKMGHDHALVGIIHDQWTP